MSLSRILIVISAAQILLTSCLDFNTRPGSLADKADYLRYFTTFKHDINENTDLLQAYSDLASLTSVDFSFDPELAIIASYVDTTLPRLTGFNVAELISMIPEIVPPEVEFEYAYEAGGRVRLHLRYLEADI